jgi:hypothetical protein
LDNVEYYVVVFCTVYRINMDTLGLVIFVALYNIYIEHLFISYK